MNPKRIEITMFTNLYVVAFYKDGINKQYEFNTDNPLAVGYMINVWMERPDTSEELMCQLIGDIAQHPMNLEQHLNEVIEKIEQTDVSGTDCDKKRLIRILSAIKGYMTEDGTTWEQDNLLREIGVKAQR